MKKFKLEFEFTEDGGLMANGENDGFTAFELLGLLTWKVNDIEKQIFGDIKPDVVTRKVIKD